MNLNTFLSRLPSSFPLSKTILYQAPGRINIIGEHTDYNQGYCLPAALNKFIYFAIVPSHEIEIYSLNQNNSWTPNQTKEIPDWAIYFKGIIDLLKQKGFQWPYFRLAFGGDLPIGAGLSSSSSISCGFISILNEFATLNLTKEKLTFFAVEGEKASGLAGGMMDQITIINASLNKALFIDCLDWSFKHIPIPTNGVCWLIVDTKVKHKLVDTDYNSRSKLCNEIYLTAKQLYHDLKSISLLDHDKQIELYNILSVQKVNFLRYVLEENQRVKNIIPALATNDYSKVGNLLFESHTGLRKLFKVSCNELDFLVNYAQNSSKVYGARMMGGGFGGSTLHLIDIQNKFNYMDGITNAYKNCFGYEPNVFEAGFENGVCRID